MTAMERKSSRMDTLVSLSFIQTLTNYDWLEYFDITDKDGQIQGYAFNGDPFEVFEYFFGTLNPDVVALDETGKQVKLLEKIESDLHRDAITER